VNYGYAEWLSTKEWTHWTTWTFPTPAGSGDRIGWTKVGTTGALRAFQRFWQMSVWSKALSQTSFGLVAIESHKTGAKHVHALIGNEALRGRVIAYQLPHLWTYVGGGFCRIQAYNGSPGVHAYCAKYAIKDDALHFVGNWSKRPTNVHGRVD